MLRVGHHVSTACRRQAPLALSALAPLRAPHASSRFLCHRSLSTGTAVGARNPFLHSSFRTRAARLSSSGDAEGAPNRARGKKKGGPGPAVIGLSVLGAGVAAYLILSSDRFEEFLDSTRESLESISDWFFPQSDEPWLLDFATMKYPDNIPTLVLDLDKVIIHLSHDRKAGWQVVKRPFADQFLKEMSQYYEVVIFSDDVREVLDRVVQQWLQKWEIPVAAVLHRDFCKKKRSTYIKDLSRLGRSMDRVLCIDHDAGAFQLQPENGIVIREFNGDPNDSELAVLSDFLKAAARNAAQGSDIRKEVQKFGGGDEDIGRRFLAHKDEPEELGFSFSD